MTMQLLQTKFSKKEMVKWTLTLILPVCVLGLPVNEVYTADIRLFLTITLFAILMIAFELLDYMIPSILLPTAYVLLKLAPGSVVFSGWTQTTPFMIIGGFLLANVLTEVKLMQRIAFWCIAKVGGSFNGMLYGLALMAIIITFLTSGKSYVIVAAICAGLIKSLQLEPGKDSATLMLAGMAACTFAITGFVFSPQFMSIMVAGAQTVIPDFTVDYLSYMLHTWPWIIMVFVLIFIMTKIDKPDQDINGKAYFEEEYKKLGKVSVQEKKAAAVTAALIIFLATSRFHGIALDYGFIIFPWLFFMPGINIGTKRAIRDINYQMVFFMVACISIGSVSSAIGLGKIVSQVLAPILQPIGPRMIVVVVWFLGIILNALMTPIAVIGAFSAPVAQLALDLGLNPTGVMYALVNSMDMVVMPYESVPYLVAFSFGYISMPRFIKFSLLKMAVATVFLIIVMIPYWLLLGVL